MIRRRILLVGLGVLALVVANCTGSITPKGGSSFTGTIDLGDKGSSGAIRFKVSEDGASITDLDITIKDLKCDGLSAGRVHDYLHDPRISIIDVGFNASLPAIGGEVKNYNLDSSPSAFPSFTSLDSVGQIEGKFASATEASGNIKIYMWVVMTDHACELGTFPWRAETP